MFNSEFMSEMESQMGEAMKAISDENPELWEQFNTFTKSMGKENFGEGPVIPSATAATKGESSVDGDLEGTQGTADDVRSESGHLDQVLDQTLKNLQENTLQVVKYSYWCRYGKSGPLHWGVGWVNGRVLQGFMRLLS